MAVAVVAAIVVVPLVAILAPAVIDSVTGECSDGERRTFREFQQYGGKQLEPEYRGSVGCFVTLTTEDPPEDVLSYYRQELTTRDWTLEQPPLSLEGEPGQPEAGGLNAARDRFGYQVLLEPAREGTSVVVYVIERED